jgi:LuxR family maltose regulon positive regulatory protein
VETSLLTTKLNIPPARHQLVSRHQLYERLQDGLNYGLILVSAPAGFGKTTLVSEWVRQNQKEISAAWLSLDEGDNDPVRFWDYFIASIKTLRSDFGESTRALLHTPQPPTVEELLTVLINELASISTEFVFVLDDYHLIESKEIHNSITYLLEHPPARMHLIMASRTDPPLPLARLRGKGKMLEVGTDDLRFRLEDAASLLKELKVPELSVEDVAALNERTEGWVVGLKMASRFDIGAERYPLIYRRFYRQPALCNGLFAGRGAAKAT